jgi:hypothetical protein
MNPLTNEFLISYRRKSPNSNSNGRGSHKKMSQNATWPLPPSPQGNVPEANMAPPPMFQLPWVPHVPIALGPPCSNCPGSPMFQLPWVPHVPIALGPPCSNCPGSCQKRAQNLDSGNSLKMRVRARKKSPASDKIAQFRPFRADGSVNNRVSDF